MDKNNQIQYLIVDTSAFIKNAALQDIGINICTEQAVVDEITDKKQLRRLVVLPYDLKVQEAFPENIKLVTEFSKKTGDYSSLSATDIKVIALTYQLEKEKVGIEHLKDTPICRSTVKSTTNKREDDLKPLAGFYLPDKTEETEFNKNNNTEASLNHMEQTEQDLEESNIHTEIVKDSTVNNISSNAEDAKIQLESNYNRTLISNIEEEVTEKFDQLTYESTDCVTQDENKDKYVDGILTQINTITSNESDVESTEDEDDSDNGWITPGNIVNLKKQTDSEVSQEKTAVVACLTMDFAMQNVLMQMGLNVASLDGRVIKQMRTFIFRCYACFKTTSIMTKVFCPYCGNKTLKKVEVTLDENGKQQIHINFRRPLSAKGKKFSLPMPKGGKHANNPILCEDQPMPQQHPSRLARTKNNPLNDDYIAGYSPFIMRDVNSKSAMLGIKPGHTIKHWMKRNPNESRGKRK